MHGTNISPPFYLIYLCGKYALCCCRNLRDGRRKIASNDKRTDGSRITFTYNKQCL